VSRRAGAKQVLLAQTTCVKHTDCAEMKPVMLAQPNLYGGRGFSVDNLSGVVSLLDERRFTDSQLFGICSMFKYV
jgi:hypothetical protein